MTISTADNENFIFTGSCHATTGVVAAVTSFLADRDCYICALEQFDGRVNQKIFYASSFSSANELS